MAAPRRVRVDYRDPHPRKIVDPANGERVPRCRTCGAPSKGEIRGGTWNGVPLLPYPTCGECVGPFLVRDPLEAA